MNRRQRFLETMTFGRPDRPASGDYLVYEATRARWEREGLPAGADLNAFFGMDFDPFAWKVPANMAIVPAFERTVLKEDEDGQTVRTPAGDVVRVLKDHPPPAMPVWVRYPVQSRADWEDHRRRLDPDSPGRLPEDFASAAVALRNRDYPLGLWLTGSYGPIRNWWGLEETSMLLYDDPALVEEMIAQLTHLSIRMLERVLACGVELDWVMFWEDLAYKNGPLISPQHFRRYCMPYYRAVMEKVRAARVPVVMVDSDGDIREIIPFWLDVGVTVMHPMEVAAGMDVAAARRQYGKGIGFFGGIDKRALAGTREDIRRDALPKLRACFEDGGFIPACDHAVPPDVPLDNYLYYRELVADAAGS